MFVTVNIRGCINLDSVHLSLDVTLNTIKGHCNKVYEDATVPGSLNPQKGTVSNHTGHNTARVIAGYSPLLLLSSVTQNVELHLLCLGTVSSEMSAYLSQGHHRHLRTVSWYTVTTAVVSVACHSLRAPPQ